MITALLLGAGTGLGLWALTVWALPPRPALHHVLTRLTEPPPASPAEPILTPTTQPDWAARLGRPLAPLLRAAGLPAAGLRRDLVITDTSPDVYLARKATLALLGLLTPPVLALVLTLLGAPPGGLIPVLGAIGLAAVGFLLPDLRIRAEAARRRTDFRHALSAYLDLVVVSLAGGAGVDGALTDSAAIGHGWAFTRVRRALEHARLTRSTVWTALRQLGTELDIGELTELAAATTLAGTEGARVRASLAARAQSLRTHQLTDAEAAAHAATERMGLPWGLLFLGFLIFIGYPAVHQILTGL